MDAGERICDGKDIMKFVNDVGVHKDVLEEGTQRHWQHRTIISLYGVDGSR